MVLGWWMTKRKIRRSVTASHFEGKIDTSLRIQTFIMATCIIFSRTLRTLSNICRFNSLLTLLSLISVGMFPKMLYAEYSRPPNPHSKWIPYENSSLQLCKTIEQARRIHADEDKGNSSSAFYGSGQDLILFRISSGIVYIHSDIWYGFLDRLSGWRTTSNYAGHRKIKTCLEWDSNPWSQCLNGEDPRLRHKADPNFRLFSWEYQELRAKCMLFIHL
jgi:hypothetical protein